nr:unnamed protein product [Spirometra erinaceieuropaei]
MFSANAPLQSPYTITLPVDHHPVKFEIDTGSAVTLINEASFQKLPSLLPANSTFRSYTGQNVENPRPRPNGCVSSRGGQSHSQFALGAVRALRFHLAVADGTADMVKRRVRRARLEKEERKYDQGDSKSSPMLSLKRQFKRDKRKDRKAKLKEGKLNFKQICQDFVKADQPEKPSLQLPQSLPMARVSEATLAYVSSFVNTLLNIFENQASLHRVREVYCDEVTVTFQATPYILKKAVTSDLPNRQTRKHYTRDDMLMYLLVSSSLLKGSWPLPSWAWAVDCQTGEKNLDKKRRKELRSLQKFQSENEGRIKKSIRKRRFTSISEFQGTHSTQFFAANPWEIQQLYARIPRLIAIRDDSTTTIDIVESSVTQIPQVPHVRWVHRAIILRPPPVDKICHEDVCVIPVSETEQERHSSVIQRAIEEWTRRSAEDGGAGAGAVGSGSVNVVAVGAACGRDGDGDGVERSAVLEDELAAKIAELSAGTGMNREFSRQCLEECAWSLELAFEAFRRVREAGMLPEVALSG